MKKRNRQAGIIESFVCNAGEVKHNARHIHIAQVTAGGQLSIPIEIRRALKLAKGDTLSFRSDGNGKIIFSKL